MKQNFMKWNMILWSLCGILFLSGCNGSGREELPSGDSINYADYIGQRDAIAYTDSAMLFLNWDHIYYLDAALSAPLSPLCTRANCDHRRSDCSSYVGTNACIYAWHNQIYYLEYGGYGGPVLYRMDIDGTNREKVRDFEDLFLDMDCTYGMSLGGGYVVFEGDFQRATGGQPFLYLASIEDSKEEPIPVYLGEEGSPTYVWGPPKVCGDWVFYYLYEEEEPDFVTLMGYRISTGETVELAEPREYWNAPSPLMMQGSTVYLSARAGGVFTCDMDTMETRQVIEWNLPWERAEGEYYQYSVLADHEYIYFADLGMLYLDESGVRFDTHGKTELTIYDLEGREIQQISYAWEEERLEYFLATPDYIIWGESDGFQITPTHYLKRSDIAEGKAEFIAIGQ